jgi:hypothetical protein
LELFSEVNSSLKEAAETISSILTPVRLVTRATLVDVLALAQIEASFLDQKIPYQRTIVEGPIVPTSISGPAIIISSGVETKWVVEAKKLLISPTTINVKMGSENKVRTGVLGTVAQSAALAAKLSPSGIRTRRQRGMSCSGQWLRDTLDSVYDPVWTIIRDHLQMEGTVQVLPITEITNIEELTLPNLPARTFKRLKRAWGSFDAKERAGALSELVLPMVEGENVSAARLEELVWHRVIGTDWPMDLASLLFHAQNEWPDEGEVLHAGRVMDKLISTGLPV